ncbi:MAG: nucleotidyltransferase domain-containing protein [Synergistaceae bacterium]|nr:nucleotidyltransferase domain-containing protein [Synergistaceae bacterium]
MPRVLQLDEIRDTVSELGRKYGLERAYLFGSYARGEATPESDVDIRIDSGQLRGLFALSGLRLALVDRLGREVDLLTTDSLDAKFLKRIEPEEVLLYGNN